LCDAQTLQQNTAVVSSGASIVNGSEYSGNVTVGTIFLAHDSALSDVATQNTIVNLKQVFPNPSTGGFTIDSLILGNHTQAMLYDECGACVLDATMLMSQNGSRVAFNLKGVTQGSYILLVQNASTHYEYKVSILK
jgi:hypothetical protein